MSTNVEQIKEKLDIVDVISSYIKVEKAGINFKAKCPFHNEKTPSFFISATRQSFYCFGCGEKGDIFSFVEKFEGLDFKGALETLANRAGVELKNFKKEEGERPEEKDKLFEIMEEATKIYEEELTKNKAVLKYLEKRGLTPASISKWRLGFAPDDWRDLHDHLIKKGFSKEDMIGAGLIKIASSQPSPEATAGKAEQAKYYDTFRNRIMFPICDSAGRVIAFSGRAMKEDEKTPKYLNSPETKLFYKSEVLYGFNIAKNYIRKLDYAVLVEGQMDLVISHQANVLNTVASSGTALTELHLRKIQKLSSRIIIAYDSDLAGEKASRRAAELALSLGMEVKIASLPKGEDPASVAKEDPEKWKKALRESEHFIDFALNKAIKENQGRNLTKEVIKNVLPLISLIKSEIEKTQFVKKIALKMKVKEEDVWNDIKKIASTEKILNDESSTSKYPSVINLERIMVGLVYLEESSNEPSSLKEKWQKILGEKEVENILNNYKENKEALIFEVEMHALGIDIKETKNQILLRIELENLKQKLQKIAIFFDDDSISKDEEKKAKLEFEKIQKRIKELNN
jgi:DNA primase